MFLGPDLKRAESAESASSQEGRAILRAKPVCMQNLLSESPEGLDGCDTVSISLAGCLFLSGLRGGGGVCGVQLCGWYAGFVCSRGVLVWRGGAP